MCKDSSSGGADLTSGPHKLKIIYTLCENTVLIVLTEAASFFVFFFFGRGGLEKMSMLRKKKIYDTC